VDAKWLDDVLRDAPLRVERIEVSHNAAAPHAEVIRIGLAYLVVVWNPFVTTIAKEAGKGAYAAIHGWLRSLWDRLVELRNPVIVLEFHIDDCQVLFLFRGKDVKQNYEAHDALPIAATRAAKLVANMKTKSVAPASLVYEFEAQLVRWFPSYATLYDGQLVSDRNILIAIEQLPIGLSLGLVRGKDAPRKPT
jgi:hypothetical protein